MSPRAYCKQTGPTDDGTFYQIDGADVKESDANHAGEPLSQPKSNESGEPVYAKVRPTFAKDKVKDKPVECGNYKGEQKGRRHRVNAQFTINNAQLRTYGRQLCIVHCELSICNGSSAEAEVVPVKDDGLPGRNIA